jgi:hypothetical protein
MKWDRVERIGEGVVVNRRGEEGGREGRREGEEGGKQGVGGATRACWRKW